MRGKEESPPLLGSGNNFSIFRNHVNKKEGVLTKVRRSIETERGSISLFTSSDTSITVIDKICKVVFATFRDLRFFRRAIVSILLFYAIY